jgi:hypothetical protein
MAAFVTLCRKGLPEVGRLASKYPPQVREEELEGGACKPKFLLKYVIRPEVNHEIVPEIQGARLHVKWRSDRLVTVRVYHNFRSAVKLHKLVKVCYIYS